MESMPEVTKGMEVMELVAQVSEASAYEIVGITRSLTHFIHELHVRGAAIPVEEVVTHVQATMDAKALSFIISSWDVAWQRVQFGGTRACAFEHAAFVPIVSVFVPTLEEDGYCVYTSGPKPSMQHFLQFLEHELTN